MDKRFSLEVSETFMGYLARLYDNHCDMWVRTINVNGTNGAAYDGFREYSDVFTAANAIVDAYLLDEARREAAIQDRLARWAA